MVLTSNSGIVNGPQQGSGADLQTLVIDDTDAPSDICSIDGNGDFQVHQDCAVTVESFSSNVEWTGTTQSNFIRAGTFILTGDGDQVINFGTAFTGSGNDVFVTVNPADEVFPAVSVESTSLTGFEANRVDGYVGSSTHTYIANNIGAGAVEYYYANCRVLHNFNEIIEFKASPQAKINGLINTDFGGFEGGGRVDMSSGDVLKFQPQIPSNTSVAGVGARASN